MSDKKKSRLVLVTGATGTVGPRIVSILHDAGYDIRTLSLDSPQLDQFSRDIEFVTGDVTKAADVESAMKGVDGVIHLAALLHVIDPPPELEQKYREINVGGTEVVTRLALEAKVKRLVYISTISVYGKSDFKILDESAPTNPVTFYEQTKLAAEQIVLDAKNGMGLPIGTVLRLAAVYGSKVKGNYRKLLEALEQKRFIPIGEGLNRRTLVYDKDVARAALLALEHPDAAGKIFNVSDGEYHTLSKIIKTMCEAIGRKPPSFSLPVELIRQVVKLTEGAAKMLHVKPTVTISSIDKYTEDIAIDSRRIQKELGFTPKYNLSAGWAETIQEMRRMGHFC